MSELTSMIRMLLEKTEAGKLRWQKTEEAPTLQARLADGTAFALDCDASTAGLTTRGTDGEVIAGLSVSKLGSFMPGEAMLRELAAAAGRSAAGGNERTQAVLEAVRGL